MLKIRQFNSAAQYLPVEEWQSNNTRRLHFPYSNYYVPIRAEKFEHEVQILYFITFNSLKLDLGCFRRYKLVLLSAMVHAACVVCSEPSLQWSYVMDRAKCFQSTLLSFCTWFCINFWLQHIQKPFIPAKFFHHSHFELYVPM